LSSLTQCLAAYSLQLEFKHNCVLRHLNYVVNNFLFCSATNDFPKKRLNSLENSEPQLTIFSIAD
jgi:hypothetical protein